MMLRNLNLGKVSYAYCGSVENKSRNARINALDLWELALADDDGSLIRRFKISDLQDLNSDLRKQDTNLLVQAIASKSYSVLTALLKKGFTWRDGIRGSLGPFQNALHCAVKKKDQVALELLCKQLQESTEHLKMLIELVETGKCPPDVIEESNRLSDLICFSLTLIVAEKLLSNDFTGSEVIKEANHIARSWHRKKVEVPAKKLKVDPRFTKAPKLLIKSDKLGPDWNEIRYVK